MGYCTREECQCETLEDKAHCSYWIIEIMNGFGPINEESDNDEQQD